MDLSLIPAEELVAATGDGGSRVHWEGPSLELRDSIARLGILEPLIVRRRGAGFELISGYRRLSARAKQTSPVPCWVAEADDEQALVLALEQDLRAAPPSDAELGVALGRLAVRHGWSEERIASWIMSVTGQSWSARRVRHLKLVAELPDPVILAVHRGRLTVEQARLLHSASDEVANLALELSSRVRFNVNLWRETLDLLEDLAVSQPSVYEELGSMWLRRAGERFVESGAVPTPNAREIVDTLRRVMRPAVEAAASVSRKAADRLRRRTGIVASWDRALESNEVSFDVRACSPDELREKVLAIAELASEGVLDDVFPARVVERLGADARGVDGGQGLEID